PTHSEVPVECPVPGYRAPQRFEPPRPADFTGEWTDWLSEQDIPEYGGTVVPFPGPRGDVRSETRGLPAGLRAVLGVVLGAGVLAGCLARVGVVG
ncbi:MAG: hypothetical protein J2P17_20825, partial [Mycobacterium sp.]|nr:hypothetical protein [Mycobacterium sp.]